MPLVLRRRLARHIRSTKGDYVLCAKQNNGENTKVDWEELEYEPRQSSEKPKAFPEISILDFIIRKGWEVPSSREGQIQTAPGTGSSGARSVICVADHPGRLV
jgi:hypothetical protein